MDERDRLAVLLAEYQKLKDEQLKRIGVRDNLIYVGIGVLGAVLSFTLGRESSYLALLVFPPVAFVLGWTYLVNDEKVSAIGRYIRGPLRKRVGELVGPEEEMLFGWEVAHRSDDRRVRRKVVQLLVDELTFVVSGLSVSVAVCCLLPTVGVGTAVVVSIEVALQMVLGVEIVLHADFGRGG